MDISNANYEFAQSLAGALAELGLRHAVISPGSRNTPLTLAFAAEPRISDWSVHDERSGGFFAIGLATPDRTPVALICTSGTAAAEYHPAVVEAALAEVPLIVLTADRPPELSDVGAPQAIDQVGLYGTSVKWFHDTGVPEASGLLASSAPSLAAHAWSIATEAPAGPVHLNARFREPLVPVDVPGDNRRTPPPTPRLLDPSAAGDSVVPDSVAAAVAGQLDGKKVLVVAGPHPETALPPILAGLAVTAGWPVLADPLSGLRAGTHPMDAIVSTGDLLARSGVLDRLRPDVVLRIGRIPTSKAVWRWLEANRDIPQIVVGAGRWSDATASASMIVRGRAASLLRGLGARIAPSPEPWESDWHGVNSAAAAAIDRALATEDFPNEPAVARTVLAKASDPSTLWVGSSMPVRDLDGFGGLRRGQIAIHGNRGANGIDGLLSAAAGTAGRSSVAGSGDSGRTVVLAGDLSVLHDISALATIGRLGLDVTIVVVNNDGGGIFHFLDQRSQPQFERHFGTPHGLAFAPVAESFGVAAQRVETGAALTTGLSDGGPLLLEIMTDRATNVDVHSRLIASVAALLRTR